MKGFKTIITNGLLMLFAGIEFATGEVLVVEDTTAVIAGVVGAVNIALRFFTSTSIGSKT